MVKVMVRVMVRVRVRVKVRVRVRVRSQRVSLTDRLSVLILALEAGLFPDSTYEKHSRPRV